jgi:hypothetical protein
LTLLLMVDGLRTSCLFSGSYVAPGMQQVRDCDPFQLGENPGGDHRGPLPQK